MTKKKERKEVEVVDIFIPDSMVKIQLKTMKEFLSTMHEDGMYFKCNGMYWVLGEDTVYLCEVGK